MSATSGKESIEVKELVDAMRRFCRSIELCNDYIRGYYGLMIVRLPSPAKHELIE